MDGLRPAGLGGDGPAAPSTLDGPPFDEGEASGEDYEQPHRVQALTLPLRDRPLGEERQGGTSPNSNSPVDSTRAKDMFDGEGGSYARGSSNGAPVHSTSLVNHDATFKPLPPEQVASFLEARGFLAIDEVRWRLSKPRDWANFMPAVGFSVKRHEEAGAHTWYAIETELVLPHSEKKLAWQAPRRLAHLRDFHDHLKKVLGQENYDNMFLDRAGSRVHFASRGGVPGTTARLDAWLSALAIAVNYGRTSPTVVALVLHFLRAPAFGVETEEGQEVEEEVVAFSPSNTGPDPGPHPESPHPHEIGRSF